MYSTLPSLPLNNKHTHTPTHTLSPGACALAPKMGCEPELAPPRASKLIGCHQGVICIVWVCPEPESEWMACSVQIATRQSTSRDLRSSTHTHTHNASAALVHIVLAIGTEVGRGSNHVQQKKPQPWQNRSNMGKWYVCLIHSGD